MTWFHVESINYPCTEGTPLHHTFMYVSWARSVPYTHEMYWYVYMQILHNIS